MTEMETVAVMLFREMMGMFERDSNMAGLSQGIGLSCPFSRIHWERGRA
jgi:hypothetical protein